ncbi:MAG: alkaline phosphatase [Chitinispirillaceae bacterium]|nr:alkaline phosphatase [Chitinispirillaceae bacterium]
MKKTQERVVSLFILLPVLFIVVCTAPPVTQMPVTTELQGVAKNIIILIPDGCGTAHMTLTRWVKGSSLAQDAMNAGLVKTNSVNSIITGSAAAATAIACGTKTREQDGGVKCLGILPDSAALPLTFKDTIIGKLHDTLQWKPVSSVLEGARLAGKATGLVATARISHATPAGFSSHWHDRDNENVLMEQQVYGNIDVVFGGGMRHLLPSTQTIGKRKDNEDLKKVLLGRGYTIISTSDELKNLPAQTRKVWGLFSTSHLAPAIDRKYTGKKEPSIAEMTRKAIQILSKNKEGFLLVVEGSQVDWASHNNDPAGVVTEYLAFDSAVAVALAFARTSPATEVLIFPDHDNGGMSIGNRNTDETYTDLKPEQVVKPIRDVTITSAGLLDSLIRISKTGNTVDSTIVVQHLSTLMSISDISSQDTADIREIVKSVKDEKNNRADVASVGRILSRRCAIGWSTIGHAAHDVPFFSLRKNSHEVIDNTQIAQYVAGWLGFDLEKVNKRLVNEAHSLFAEAKDITISLDTTGAADGNGSVTVKGAKKSVMFPFYKNIMIDLSKPDTVELEGLTMYSQIGNKVYLPWQAKVAFQAVK